MSYIAVLKSNLALILILGVSLFFNFWQINWGLPYPAPVPWLQDMPDEIRQGVRADPVAFGVGIRAEKNMAVTEGSAPWTYNGITPIGPLAAARDKFSWGRWSQRASLAYPLGHYIVLAAFYSPYVGYLALSGGLKASAGPGYPYGLADPTTSLSIFELIARSVSALMGAGVVLATFLLVREMWGRRAGLFAALMVAVCYTLIYYAHVTTLDMPYIFWFMWAFYLFILAGKRGAPRYYLLFGLLGGMAFASKDQVYALLFPLVLLTPWLHYRRHYPGGFEPGKFLRSLWHREIFYGLGGFIGAYTIFNNLIFNFPRAVLHFIQIQHLKDWDRTLDPAIWSHHFILFGQTINYVIPALGLPLFLVCAVGLIYCLYRTPQQTLLLVAPLISYYLLIIEFSAFYVHTRHTVIIAVVLTFFGGKLLADLLEWARLPRLALSGALAAIFAYSGLYAAGVGVAFAQDTQRSSEQWIREHITTPATIEVYAAPAFLPYSISLRHTVKMVDFYSLTYLQDVKARKSDYIILSEKVYRAGERLTEEEALARGLENMPQLRQLLNGELGHTLRADFKHNPQGLLPFIPNPDILYGRNPRIMILERTQDWVVK